MTNIGTIEIQDLFVGSNNAVGLYLGAAKVWQRETPVQESPLCFTGTGTDSVRLVKVGSPDSANIEYSKNGNTWTAYTFGTWIEFDGADHKVYFRGATDNNTSFYTDASNYYRFELDENYPTTVSGNLDTLLNKNGTRHITKSRTYRELFMGMSGLTDASQLELPSDTMTLQSYYGMFQNCTTLSAAPELPATTLASSCYRVMFSGCTSLKSTPELSVTSLAEYCYRSMFQGCTSLTDGPELPATTLASNCYVSMFDGCSSLSSITVGFSDWQAASSTTTNWVNGVAASGTFTCPSGLSDVRGASNIPSGWTIVTT